MNIKRILRRIIYGEDPYNCDINWLKTFFYNFQWLPFKNAIKLPIYIYSNTRIYNNGKIYLSSPISTGMVKIGNIQIKTAQKTKIINHGIINFETGVNIAGGTILENDGIVSLKKNVYISEGCLIIIRESLTIGKYSSIGFKSFISDSDEHFTINIETHEIHPIFKSIIIGEYNWIGNTTYIKKGTITPDFLIVASANSLLTKDYRNVFPPYSIIGGMPIRLLKQGYRRIYNPSEQRMLRSWYSKHPNEIYRFDNKNQNLESFCC